MLGGVESLHRSRVFGRVIHHGPLAGTELPHAIGVIFAAFLAALVRTSGLAFALPSSRVAAGVGAVDLAPVAITADVEDALATRFRRKSEQAVSANIA